MWLLKLKWNNTFNVQTDKASRGTEHHLSTWKTSGCHSLTLKKHACLRIKRSYACIDGVGSSLKRVEFESGKYRQFISA